MKEKYCLLKDLVKKYSIFPYCLESRIHKTKTFKNSHANIYIKRDDELSCMISGSKIRKYASLIPSLIERKVGLCALIGGAFSNNILGLCQLLIENSIKPLLFLRKPGTFYCHGNLFLSQLLVDSNDIEWIPRNKWAQVEQHVQEQISISDSFLKTMIIPEGSLIREALPGAMTLSLDIFRNESEDDLNFDHIIVDAGTGLQAIAVIIAHAWACSRTKIHILLLAQSYEDFNIRLNQFKIIFEELFDTTLPEINNFILHRPRNAPSFGSVNKKLTDYISYFARHEGIIIDPIYSGKLMYESNEIIKGISGNILLVHSGGSLSLMGYSHLFKQELFNKSE